MNYQEALDYLSVLGPTLERPSLTRMESFFAEKGAPQDKLKAVHVGGTNGKGSVTTFINSIFRELGFASGKFTGPHLIKFNERFEMNGRIISDDEFAGAAGVVAIESEAFALRHPELGLLTWFEFLMAMSVHLFIENNVSPAVFEVGLGGRFDATNVLHKPQVSVITNVDLDHVHLLGDTREKIAFEKAGIIKKNAPVVTLASGGALGVIKERAQEMAAPLIVLGGGADGNLFKSFTMDLYGEQYLSEAARQWLARLDLSLRTRSEPIALGLSGAYQRNNALAALFAAALYLSGEAVEPLSNTIDWQIETSLVGLTKARWPGRFELHKELPVILDGAHNPHGAFALRCSLDEMYPGRPCIFVFGCFENKNMEDMLCGLLRKGDVVLCPEITNVRATRQASEIIAIAEKLGARGSKYPDLKAAVDAGLQLLGDDNSFADRLIVTGSFAMVRELIQLN